MWSKGQAGIYLHLQVFEILHLLQAQIMQVSGAESGLGLSLKVHSRAVFDMLTSRELSANVWTMVWTFCWHLVRACVLVMCAAKTVSSAYLNSLRHSP